MQINLAMKDAKHEKITKMLEPNKSFYLCSSVEKNKKADINTGSFRCKLTLVSLTASLFLFNFIQAFTVDTQCCGWPRFHSA